MKVKLTILILSAFLLWSGLLTVSHQNHFSKQKEVKIASEVFTKTIVSEDFIWKKISYYPQLIFKNFVSDKVHAERKRVETAIGSTKKSVKYFLLFRVLRN
ncbi:MAG TPA: hypothetical protein VE467_11990 [Chryseolinea sp.]|jgi:hypothetical protein|nr:hypothetical protein [Chryseolinea sp.]